MTSRVRLGPAAALIAGGDSRYIVHDGGPEPYKSIVVLRHDEGVCAYWNVCRHLPVPLDGGAGEVEIDHEGHLVCQTHGARYRPHDGYCVEGPCPGDQLYPIEIVDEDGELFGVIGDDGGPVEDDS